MLYIGKTPKGKFPYTWQFWNIKIPKPAYVSSPKIIGFLHFFKFWGPSEKKIQFTVFNDHPVANFNTHANVDDDFYVFSRIDIDVNVT